MICSIPVFLVLHYLPEFAQIYDHWVEKAMAPYSSTLAWKIPRTEEAGRLQSMGSLSQTWLSNFTFTFHFHALEKEMATHSGVLAWRIPGTSMGLRRVRHDWSDSAAATWPLSQWCYPTTSFSVTHLYFCPQYFPAVSNELALHNRWPKYCSFSINVSPSSEYSGLISLGPTGLISLLFKGLSRVFISNWCFFESIKSSGLSLLYGPTHILTCLLEVIASVEMDLFLQSAILCTVYVCHTFPFKEQVSFDFVAPVTIHSDFGAQGNKACHYFHFFPSIWHEMMGLDAMILLFWMLSFKPIFFTLIFNLH